jgi:hypothetical protein
MYRTERGAVYIMLETLALASLIWHCLVPTVGHIGVKAAVSWVGHAISISQTAAGREILHC